MHPTRLTSLQKIAFGIPLLILLSSAGVRAEPEACKKPVNPKPACIKASEAYTAFMGCWNGEYQRIGALPTNRMDLNFCCSAQELAAQGTRCHGYAKIKTTNTATASLGNPCFQKFIDFSRSLTLCP